MIAAMIEAVPKKISKRFLPVVAQVTASARKRLRLGADEVRWRRRARHRNICPLVGLHCLQHQDTLLTGCHAIDLDRDHAVIVDRIVTIAALSLE